MSLTVLKWPAKKSAEAALAVLRGHPVRELALRLVERRAFEAVVWGMPAVHFDLLYQAMARLGGRWNEIACWSPLAGWKNQTLAPDPDEVSFMAFFDTRLAGPMVLEIPPAEDGAIIASIHNGWQVVLEDSAGKAQGVKYLILPPAYDGAVPKGYLVVPSDTYRGFALLRINAESGDEENIIRAVSCGRQVKLYPLAQSAYPPPTTFVDTSAESFDSTIPYDLRFFEALNRFIQYEPWLARDRAMIDVLGSVGIEKDEVFDPDAGLSAVLAHGAAEAQAWLDCEYKAALATPYFPKGRWAVPAFPDVLAAIRSNFGRQGRYRVDRRAVLYSTAFFGARHLDDDRFYLLAARDADGEELDGAASYRLTVPPSPPAEWSATLYDRESHALIRGAGRCGRGAHTPGLRVNPDGAVDLYFGARPPAGKRANWVPTAPDRRFQILFRFHRPQKSLFDNSWILPDIQKQQ